MNSKSTAIQPKIKINKWDFIQWYFKDSDTWVLKDIRFKLVNYGEYELELFTLFDECELIPAYTRIDYDHKKHFNEAYEPKDCTLV